MSYVINFLNEENKIRIKKKKSTRIIKKLKYAYLVIIFINLKRREAMIIPYFLFKSGTYSNFNILLLSLFPAYVACTSTFSTRI